jgi:hypothetical protein
MRKLVFLVATLLLLGCQDVIEVELPTEEPRLVIDGLIRINDMSQPLVSVKIRASLSSSYFDSVQPARLQEITLTNTDTKVSTHLKEKITGTGIYEEEWILGQLTEGNLELNIRHNDQIYLARTKFVPAVPIDSLRQGTTTLFGDDETEVLVNFTDDGKRNDFYLFDFNFGEYLVTEDEFYQGQQFEFSFFYDKNLKDDRELQISLLGIDETFFNYMNQLIIQSGPDTGPFSTPATTVRGNIVNITNNNETNKNNFALGYFAVCQTFSRTITIKK